MAGRSDDGGEGSWRRLLLLGGGTCTIFTLVTVLEEELFLNERFLSEAGGAFMTLVMYSFSVLVYLLARRFAPTGGDRSRPLNTSRRRDILVVSTLYVGTTTLTKSSLRYIDMPTQTVLKSAKLLPVMLGSMVILRRRFSSREWLSALMLVCGVAIFNSSTYAPSFRQTALGYSCIGVALTCDALLGNYQQKVLSRGVTVNELMLYQSASGMVYMLAVVVGSGRLGSGVALLRDEPVVAGSLALWCAAITAGTALVLTIVDEFSAVVAIVVTTARKALTLLASFVLFPKHMGWGHPIGAALVLGSAFVTRKRKKPPPADPLLPTHDRQRAS